MNFICSIFLTLFVVFRPLVPWVEYAVNYTYISEVVCVNKSRPTLHCNGKCYLQKQLAKTGAADSSPIHKKGNTGQKLLDIYLLPETTGIQITEKPIFSGSGFFYKTVYYFLFSSAIFRPPVF